MLANDFQYANADNLVVFADNHDIRRLYDQLGKDEDLVKLALTFVLTSRGIPQLMYGTELNMEGQTDGQIRSDFPGGWPGDAVNAFTGKGLLPAQQSMQAFVKKLVRWRQGHPVLSTGKLVHYRPLKEAYVYIRYNEKGKVLVVLNKNKAALSLDLASYRAELGPARQGTDVLTGNTVSLDQPVAVPARSPLIIEIKN
jgi:glycosidase